jgi:hypothetical protein
VDPSETNGLERALFSMPQLYLITVPGLEVPSDWRLVHDRLLDEFSNVSDVLATTMKGTLLIIYEDRPHPDAWLEAVSQTVLGRRVHQRSAS